jgi:hypothetical protein
MNSSPRSATHLMGRPSRRAAHSTNTHSGEAFAKPQDLSGFLADFGVTQAPGDTPAAQMWYVELSRSNNQ